MNLALWTLFFAQHLLALLFFMSASAGLLLMVGMIEPSIELLFYPIYELPLYAWLISLALTLAVVLASLQSYRMMDYYHQIQARLTWLSLGKFHHKIFKEDYQGQWLDPDNELLQVINHLRAQLIQFSQDLQELSARPTFVTSDLTREEIVEFERKRIARELHDSVSQQLFAAAMLISALNEMDLGDSKESQPYLQQVENILSNAQNEMRALLLHLRPIDLEENSLQEGIQSLFLELNHKISLELFFAYDDISIPSGIEDHLFRIVQESLSNTLRHAKATKLEVNLRENNQVLSLTIRDNGQGFDSSQASKSGHYGLENMKERVQNMGGNIEIKSAKDLGTLIDISIPINK